MGRASDADAPITGILGGVTELPRYIGRHASADDGGPPLNDSVSADGGYDAEDSASDEPPQDGSDMARDDDEAPSMPEWWQGDQEPPLARIPPWTRPPSVRRVPLEPVTPEPEPEPVADSVEAELKASEAAESDPDESEPIESEAAAPDAEPEPLTPGPVPAPPVSASAFEPEPASVPQPAPVLDPAPMPTPTPVPKPASETEAEPEPEPDPEPALETAQRFRLSMAPRPRSELPSDEPPGDEPEADLGVERTAVPYSQALPEREAEPQVYSLPEQPYSDEPPKSGFTPRAAEPPGTDSHGLARLAMKDAIGAIWPGGTPDLTTWLADNLDLLEDPLGFALSSQQNFAWMPFQTAVRGLGGDVAPLDIPGNLVTSDLSGAAVMLRAQVDPADTEGLGALLSGASVAQAQTAVWICPRIDDDLRRTLRWIGGDPSANVRLYGLEMYLVQIGDSPTAPLFDAVVTPGSA